MGCVVSKDLRSPSAAAERTSSWNEPISKMSAVQTNRSLKIISNGSYVAAIFSTKNGLFGRNARVEDMDSKAFTQTISKKESYLKGGSCWPKVKRGADAAHMSLTADMLNNISGALVTSMKSGPELVESPKPVKITQNVESINMSEPLQGLAEEDVSTNAEDRQWANHKLSHLLNFLVEPACSSSISMKPTSAKYRPFPARRSVRTLRSKTWPSISHINSCEGDVNLFTRQVKMLQTSKSLREGLMQEKDLGSSPFIENTVFKSSVKQCDGIDDATTPRWISASSFEDLSYGNCGTLQRTLSFEQMMNDSNHEIPSRSTDAVRSDSLQFATHEYWLECERKIFSSTPGLTVSASFKDWLHNSSTYADNSPCNAQSSIPDTCQSFQFTSEVPECCQAHDSKASCFLRTDNVENQWPSSPCQDGPNLDDFGSPIFDPDMVDAFEAAVRCLSKDEWDAVRGMEDSPQKFLRLVKALKKSSSNCVRNQKENIANLGLCAIINDFNSHKIAADYCRSLEPSQDDFGSPVFDPDMVDSFEAAVRCLSKDEWDAVRGMEDSPQNLLQVVKAFKKSSSNCVRNQKENIANLGLCAIITDFNSHKIAADYCRSSGPTNRKRHLFQRKQALKRHSSFDIEKSYSQERPSDGRAMPCVVFYSSTVHVWSKAYEDCNQVRSILDSLVGIGYDEKSVSELEENEQELRGVLGTSFALVPTICVKGKCLVGIDSIFESLPEGITGVDSA